MGEQKNSSAIFCRYSPSIFSLVKNKPYDIEYGDRVFKNFKLEELTYPLKESFEKATAIFPEHEQIQKAIDTCRELGIKKNPNSPFLLISGDLSGIQDTVFTISSKGALKSLRARSFMLEFLCEHICYEIITDVLKDYKQNRNHVIFNGGGSFCLLLPNVKESIDAIEKVKNAINKWAFEEFGGKLYVAIESIELNESEIEIDKKNEDFRKKWNKLSDKLEMDKKRKFTWKLTEIFDESKLKVPKQHTNKTECQICHRDDVADNFSFYNLEKLKSIVNFEKEAEDEGVIHQLCYQLLLLGDNLTNVERIYRHNSTLSKDGFLAFPGITTSFAYYSAETKSEIFWEINGTDEDQLQFFYSNYVTKNEDLPPEIKENAFGDFKEDYQLRHAISFESLPKSKQIELENNFYLRTADFENLALYSRGADLIACLRMDVDNMGRILAEDMKPLNLVTLANLSKMLNIFFKVYLNEICKCKLGSINGVAVDPLNITAKDYSQGRKVSVVYSGGDDLFIVGAWDEVTELAYDIQRCFKEYSGLGISGGLTLHKPNFPLYQMAEISLRAVNTAKNKKDATGRETKNCIALFYNESWKIKNRKLNDRIERINRVYARNDNVNDRITLAIKWNELYEIALLTEQLDKIYDDLPHGFYQKLFAVIKIWQEDSKLYMPAMNYILRKIQDISQDKSKTEEMMKVLITLDLEKMKSLHLPLTWVENLNKKME